MKFQFLPENFSRSENAPPFETRKIRQFEVERIFLENKKMVDHFSGFMPIGIPVGFFCIVKYHLSVSGEVAAVELLKDCL